MIIYHIVPVGDRYHIVGQTPRGEDILLEKVKSDGALEFRTPEEAQDYIDEMLTLSGNFIPEAAWIDENFRCRECGSPLKVQCVIGADKSSSGYTERLCSCLNEQCLVDWSVITDKDNKLIDIQRYFIG